MIVERTASHQVGGDIPEVSVGQQEVAVNTTGKLTEMQELHGARCTQGFLRIVQNVRHGVHANLVVGGINSHGLLTHGTLVSVTRRLVVIWKGNN